MVIGSGVQLYALPQVASLIGRAIAVFMVHSLCNRNGVSRSCNETFFLKPFQISPHRLRGKAGIAEQNPLVDPFLSHQGLEDRTPDLPVGALESSLSLVVSALGVGIPMPLLQRGSIVHERIVPYSGILVIEGLGDERENMRIPYAISVAEEVMDEDRADVGFYKHRWLVESEGAYRTRGGVPNP